MVLFIVDYCSINRNYCKTISKELSMQMIKDTINIVREFYVDYCQQIQDSNLVYGGLTCMLGFICMFGGFLYIANRLSE